jgi:LPS-assembly protein
MTPDEQQRQLQFARSNPAEFTDFNIPWTLSLSYSLNFTRVLLPITVNIQQKHSQALSFNGDFSLTPKWKVGATGSYDITPHIAATAEYVYFEGNALLAIIHQCQPDRFVPFIQYFIQSQIRNSRDLKINRSRSFSRIIRVSRKGAKEQRRKYFFGLS